MVSTAVVRAAVVLAAVSDALGAPLGTDKVRKSLAVFGDIWALAVTANARVGEDGWVARVGIGGCAVVGVLQAYQRTLSFLGLTPTLYMDVSLSIR